MSNILTSIAAYLLCGLMLHFASESLKVHDSKSLFVMCIAGLGMFLTVGIAKTYDAIIEIKSRR